MWLKHCIKCPTRDLCFEKAHCFRLDFDAEYDNVSEFSEISIFSKMNEEENLFFQNEEPTDDPFDPD